MIDVGGDRITLSFEPDHKIVDTGLQAKRELVAG